MNHTPYDGYLLEMVEPPTAIWGIDQGALMRAVNLGRALFEHYFTLVGAVDILGSQHCLPTCANTALGDDEIVIAIALHELCALSDRPLIDGGTLVEQLLAISRHPVHDDRTCAVFAAT